MLMSFLRLTVLPLIVGYHGEDYNLMSFVTEEQIYDSINISRWLEYRILEERIFFLGLDTVEIEVWFLACSVTKLVFWNDEILET